MRAASRRWGGGEWEQGTSGWVGVPRGFGWGRRRACAVGGDGLVVHNPERHNHLHVCAEMVERTGKKLR